MVVAQRVPPRPQHLLEQRLRLLQLAHALQQHARADHREQRVLVAVAQRVNLRPQLLLEQRPRLLQLAHALQQHGQAGNQYRVRRPPLGHRQPRQRHPRLIGLRLAQQADDQRVAREDAHAQLHLIQDGLSNLGAEARGGAHVHLVQARLDRVEVIEERRFERRLLRRGHHRVELRAALMRVVDLLDAVGALERVGLVPRIHQQHRVPDGADALAEQRQVASRSPAQHVVAHPEERVLHPQPLLLEEVSERVEQRGDRRVGAKDHDHGGLGHVRRSLLLQPLA